MRFLSLFSGIEAASEAWAPLGWKCVGVSEVEPFACAVLKHRHSTVPNLGDVTKITEAQIAGLGQIDVLVFGSPCQDLSVAGKRKGLDGERSGLFFAAMRIAEWARLWNGLRFAVWENVPGAFSSNKGADFAAVVGALAGLDDLAVPKDGWGTEGCAIGEHGMCEWAVLDAQWFGLAQRRKRVFVVADFGDWANRPPILLEPHGLRRDTPPSREARQVAPTIPARSLGGGGLGTDFDCDGGVIVGALACNTGPNGHDAGNFACNQAVDAGHVLPVTTHTLRGEGFDASEDGTGRGTPLVPHVLALQDVTGRDKAQNGRGWSADGTSYTLDAAATQGVIAFHHNAQACQLPTPERDTSVSDPLTCSQQAAVAYGVTVHGTDPTVQKVASFSDTAQCLRARTPGSIDNSSTTVVLQMTAVAYTTKLHNTASNNAGKIFEERSSCLDANSPPPALLTASQVRRLTPTECERLQGFPDGHTAIPWRKKSPEECPDGPRYKALGNSMAVPVMRWIGRQIDFASLF